MLLPWVHIHHKDGNTLNNVWYNLQPLTKPQHHSLEITGRPRSEEYRKHISEAKLGNRNPMYNKPSNMRGKQHSEESIIKMRESHKGCVAWNKGKKLSEEHRRNLSISHKRK